MLGACEHLVVVSAAFVAEGLQRLGDALGWDEGVPAGCHAEVLQERQVEAPNHADDRLGLIYAPPDKEAGVVAVGPAPQDFALVYVVVLRHAVLKLPEETACKNPEGVVAEEPGVALDVQDAASARHRERILLILERLAEAANHLADFLPRPPALHQRRIADHEDRKSVV